MRGKSGWKPWAVACCWLLLAMPLAAQQPTRAESTAKNRTSLSITVYNSNFALVRESRRVALPAGIVRLNFEDVPRTIEASTVQLAPAPGLDVLDQSYEYDLLNPEHLLERYVGKTVTLVFRERANGSTIYRRVQALLLSTNGPVWKIGNEIVSDIHPDGYRFPALPGQLYSHPTLIWTLRNARAGERQLNVSYLAGGLNWNADYVLDLNREGSEGSLEGWVTVENNSGTSFDNAALSLVAGQVHRVSQPGPRPLVMMARPGVIGGVAQQFSQEPIGEYHLYRLNRRISLRNSESKQISLLSAARVPVEKSYIVEGNAGVFRVRQPEGAPTPEAVRLFLTFHNNAAAGLGRPLPAGIVRVYQPDSQGTPLFLGEDRIQHTPKDERVRLDVGNAFDITARRVQTDFQRIGKGVYESAFAVMLRNHKDEPVTVQVREPIGGSWVVLQSSVPAKKINAFTLEFDVPVPANGEAKLTYRVRVTD
jgi:hypothetical protein